MPLSDSSETSMLAVRPKPSPAVLSRSFATGISEVSRFSCIKFLGVLWGLRLRRTEPELALALRSCCLPPLQERRRPDCIFSELNYPPHLFPCLRFTVHLAMPSAKLGAEWIANPFS